MLWFIGLGISGISELSEDTRNIIKNAEIVYLESFTSPISSNEKEEAILNFSQFKNGRWVEPKKIASGSDWFVNWADFPAHSINGNLILISRRADKRICKAPN